MDPSSQARVTSANSESFLRALKPIHTFSWNSFQFRQSLSMLLIFWWNFEIWKRKIFGVGQFSNPYYQLFLNPPRTHTIFAANSSWQYFKQLFSSLPSNLTVWPFLGVVPNAIALTTTHSVTSPGPGQMPFEGSHAIKIPQRWQQQDHKSESFEANWITGKNVNFNFTNRDCRHPFICLTSPKQTLYQYIVFCKYQRLKEDVVQLLSSKKLNFAHYAS